MVSSSSEHWSENECLGLEIDRLRLVCEILARGVVRYRRGNAGEAGKTHRSEAKEIGGDADTRTLDCIDEDQR